ncbi:MAG: hypothetical protein ACQGQ5_05915 [Caproiciproducens sp.]
MEFSTWFSTSVEKIVKRSGNPQLKTVKNADREPFPCRKRENTVEAGRVPAEPMAE